MKSVVALALLLIAIPLSAQRQRPVRPPAPEAASLQVFVLDDANGAPLAAAEVQAFGQSFQTDASGTVVVGVSAGVSVVVTASHRTYESQSRSVTLAPGINRVELRLRPAKAAIVTMLNGTRHRVDSASVEFGYVVAFLGYSKQASLRVCSENKQFTVARADILVLTGPALNGNNRCCGAAAQMMKFKLRNGDRFDAVLSDSCEGYTMDLIGTDFSTGDAVYLPLKEIQSVEFP